MHVRTFLLALATAIAAVALSVPAAHGAPDVTYGFEDLAPGTRVTQYQEIEFGSKDGFGFVAAPGAYDHIFDGGKTFHSCDRPMLAKAPGLRGDRRLVPMCRRPPDPSVDGIESYEPAMFAAFDRTRSRVSLRFRAAPCVDQPPSNGFSGRPCELRYAMLAFNARGERVAFAVAGPREETLSVSRPTNDIAYVELGHDNGIHPDNDFIGVDDLTFDSPDTPGAPDFAMIGANVAKPAGGTYDVPIRLRRINLSSGPIHITHAELPEGIGQVTFDPNPSSGTVVTARVSISHDAPTGKPLEIKLAGDPQSDAAGTGQRYASIFVTPTTPWEISIPGGAPHLASCGTTTIRISVVPHADYRGSQIEVSMESGVFTVSPASFKAAPQGTTTREITITAGPGLAKTIPGDRFLSVETTTTSAYSAPRPKLVDVIADPPRVDQVTFPGGSSNGFLNERAGSVHVRGTGFCAGDKVDFPGASVDGLVGLGGSSISAAIPHGAGAGLIHVTTSDGRIPVSGPGVRTFRSIWGFAFENRSFVNAEATTDDILSGFSDSHTTVNACGLLTLGLKKCEVRVPHPWAFALIGRDLEGFCYGFAAASARLVKGLDVSGFPAHTRPYDVAGPSLVKSSTPGVQYDVRPPGWLADLLRRQQIMQWSGEAQSARLTEDTSMKLAERVAKMLSEGQVPVVSMRVEDAENLQADDDDTETRGHAVVAYRVVPDGSGGLDIHVYDPNDPHVEGPGLGDMARVIEVDKDSWKFEHLKYRGGVNKGRPWSGYNRGLGVTDGARIPAWGKGTILSNLFIPFVQDGTAVQDEKGASIDKVAGAEVLPSLDAAGGPTMYRLTDDRGWKINGGGAFVGNGWSATVQAPGARAARATSGSLSTTVDPKARAVSAAGARARITVSTETGGGSRTAVVEAPAGTSVAFSRGEGELLVKGRGSATVTFGSATNRSTPASARVRVPLRGGTNRIRPASWTPRGSVAVTVRSGSKQRRLRARAQRLGIRLGKPKVTDGSRSAVVKVAVGALTPVDGQLAVGARAFRSGKPVGRGASEVIGRKGGTVTLRLTGLPRGAVTIKVAATGVGTVRGAPLSGRRTRTIRAKVR